MNMWLEKTVGIAASRVGNTANALASTGFEDPSALRALDSGEKVELLASLAAEGVTIGDRQKLKTALVGARDRSKSPAARAVNSAGVSKPNSGSSGFTKLLLIGLVAGVGSECIIRSLDTGILYTSPLVVYLNLLRMGGLVIWVLLLVLGACFCK